MRVLDPRLLLGFAEKSRRVQTGTPKLPRFREACSFIFGRDRRFDFERFAGIQMGMRGFGNLKLSFLSVATIATIGCSSQEPTPYCGPEIRLTIVGNSISGATGSQYGTVEVTVEELRGQATGQRIYMVAIGSPGSGGSPLKGHITSIDLVNTSGESLHQFPTSSGPGDQITITGTTPITSVEADQIRNAFIAGNVKLVVKTDLPDVTQLQVSLVLKSMSDWNRAICS